MITVLVSLRAQLSLTLSPTGTQMNRLETLIDDLIRRLERELARRDQGTAGVGGITKAGSTTEELLGTAAEALCRANGTSLRERVRGGTPGAGTYLRILQELPARNVSDATTRVIIEKLAQDGTQGRRSRVKAMVTLRNENAHPGGDPFENATRIMRDLRDWLQKEFKRN
ncbi:MAG: hypothetical protein R3B89_34840 [Polyangiaceae bacterium]